MEEALIETPLGWAKIEGDLEGIRSISILDDKPVETIEIPELLEDAAYQLKEYFEGKRKDFQLELNPLGTEFQLRVWKELQTIPYGKQISYLELSKKLGDVKAIRAVAAANGKNPLWIVIPCHRVIGSNGDLVGYAGGLHRKKWLLNHESPAKQGSLFPN
ncbi:methylated-DNA--[protein]-cysteine S-methyltransferase [uncultured Muriicola sp.]|uniref:methylated-DNA--[protein]-cysteine S-methyltransferase n=1 Tax=uncultured Muriicola sp. TaxID=1583102 RepID=UPI00262779D9|nr:methylated-DNA--[protein]-cysteine S-methyltransferase [uncultured Muriicola sp.]